MCGCFGFLWVGLNLTFLVHVNSFLSGASFFHLIVVINRSGSNYFVAVRVESFWAALWDWLEMILILLVSVFRAGIWF